MNKNRCECKTLYQAFFVTSVQKHEAEKRRIYRREPISRILLYLCKNVVFKMLSSVRASQRKRQQKPGDKEIFQDCDIQGLDAPPIGNTG
jgi:hypothetical protein